ncbi:translation initiation factor eIF-2B subunit delta [Patella vulgata]|uniref:translation initiation factor eIF-2B subunit delta n=1 Tax=Patella vulgata TaxID=6465 RepID=UPI00217FFEE8|nr:translation initiation factor eIF-2B subunit delta [Patella vulgata]
MADCQSKDKKGAVPDNIKTPNEGKKKQKSKSKSPRGQDSVKSHSPGGAAVQQETKRPDSKIKQSDVKKDTPGTQMENPKEMKKKHSKEEIQKTNKNEIQQTKINQKSSSVDVPGSSTETTDGQPKSKAQLKAERRAVQEAQRAAKAQQKPGQQPVKKDKPQESKRVPDHVKADLPDTQKKVAKKLEKQQVPQRTSVQRKIKLFNHLQQYQREVSFTQINRFTSSGIHPAIIKLGLQYAEGLIVGSNARCVALLAAFKKVITDYITPPQKELCRDLDSKIKPYISFLIQCRPLSVSMGNAIKYLKWHITHTPHELSDSKAKQSLCECIDTFIHERITVPADAISTYACKKIADGDVIMVYACSSLIRHVLLDAYKQGKRFRVIVVDGRPKLEGRFY